MLTHEEKKFDYLETLAEELRMNGFPVEVEDNEIVIRWRDPKVELPEINSRVLLKSETGYVKTRIIRNWHISGNSLSLILGGKEVVGWRPIE